jgi:hypothetical protein
MEPGSLFGSDDFAGAIFDNKRRVYRYVLWRRWGDANNGAAANSPAALTNRAVSRGCFLTSGPV